MKQPESITLANDVVTLIPMTLERVNDFYHAGHDENIWRWTPPYKCKSLATATDWVKQGLDAVERGDQVMFGIIDNASGRFVGSTRYLSIDTDNSAIEIGYTFVNPEFQRSHINSNCKLLLITHAFEVLGAVRVQLRTHQKNQKSRNAISRLGMRYEGVFRSYVLLSTGEYRDTVFFSMLRDEWPAAKARLIDKIAGRVEQQTTGVVEIEKDVQALIEEFPLAQVMIASNDNLHDQIVYLPLQLDAQRQVLTGHMSVDNKLAWLMENSPRVTVVFQGDDAYISPLVHEKQVVPTWNYRRVHISGKFSFLPSSDNAERVKQQVMQFEGDDWRLDEQPTALMQSMLTHIRCFDIAIERLDKQFKLSCKKSKAVRESIASRLMADGQLSLAKAHSD